MSQEPQTFVELEIASTVQEILSKICEEIEQVYAQKQQRTTDDDDEEEHEETKDRTRGEGVSDDSFVSGGMTEPRGNLESVSSCSLSHDSSGGEEENEFWEPVEFEVVEAWEDEDQSPDNTDDNASSDESSCLRTFLASCPGGKTVTHCMEHLKSHNLLKKDVGTESVKNLIRKLSDGRLVYSGKQFWTRLSEYNGEPWCKEYEQEVSEYRSQSLEGDAGVKKSSERHSSRSSKKSKKTKRPSQRDTAYVRLLMRRYLKSYPSGQTLRNCNLNWERTHPRDASLVSLKKILKSMDDVELFATPACHDWVRLKKFSDVPWCDAALSELEGNQEESDRHSMSKERSSTRESSESKRSDSVEKVMRNYLEHSPRGQTLASCFNFWSKDNESATEEDLLRTLQAMDDIRVQNNGKQIWVRLKAYDMKGWCVQFQEEWKTVNKEQLETKVNLPSPPPEQPEVTSSTSELVERKRKKHRNSTEKQEHRKSSSSSKRHSDRHERMSIEGAGRRRSRGSKEHSRRHRRSESDSKRNSESLTSPEAKKNRRSGEIVIHIDEAMRKYLTPCPHGQTLTSCFNHLLTLNPTAKVADLERKLDRLNDIQLESTGKQIWVRLASKETFEFRKELYHKNCSDLEFAIVEFLKKYPHGQTFGVCLSHFERKATHIMEVSSRKIRQTLNEMEDVELRDTGLQVWLRLKEFKDWSWCNQYEKEAQGQQGKIPISSSDIEDPKVQLELATLICQRLKTMPGGMPMGSCCAYVVRSLNLRRRLFPEELRGLLKKLGIMNFEFKNSGRQLWIRLTEFADRHWCKNFLDEAKESYGSSDIGYPEPTVPSRKHHHSPHRHERKRRESGSDEIRNQPSDGGKYFEDPRVQMEITMIVCQYLQTYPQGQTLAICCSHINKSMGLNRTVTIDDMHKLMSFVSHVELKDSGKQMWVKLRIFHEMGWCKQFLQENAQYLGMESLDNRQPEPDSTTGTKPHMEQFLAQSLSPSTSHQLSSLRQQLQKPVMIAPIGTAGPSLVAAQRSMPAPPLYESPQQQVLSHATAIIAQQLEQFGIPLWTKKNDAHVDLAMQIIFYHAGTVDGGIRISDVPKLFKERTGVDLTNEEIRHLKDRIVNSGDSGLEVAPDFGTNDLRILLKFG